MCRATDTYAKIQKAFRTVSASRAPVFRWHEMNRLRENKSRRRRVRASTRQDRRFTMRNIAGELNIHQIVTQHLCAKTVPNEVSAEMSERLETGPDFLTRATTDDKN